MTPVSCGYTRNIFYGLRAPSSNGAGKLSSRAPQRARALIAANTTKVTLTRSDAPAVRED
jgi:hypothetical protein